MFIFSSSNLVPDFWQMLTPLGGIPIHGAGTFFLSFLDQPAQSIPLVPVIGKQLAQDPSYSNQANIRGTWEGCWAKNISFSWDLNLRGCKAVAAVGILFLHRSGGQSQHAEER